MDSLFPETERRHDLAPPNAPSVDDLWRKALALGLSCGVYPAHDPSVLVVECFHVVFGADRLARAAFWCHGDPLALDRVDALMVELSPTAPRPQRRPLARTTPR
jgi:hypothetical protein